MPETPRWCDDPSHPINVTGLSRFHHPRFHKRISLDKCAQDRGAISTGNANRPAGTLKSEVDGPWPRSRDAQGLERAETPPRAVPARIERTTPGLPRSVCSSRSQGGRKNEMPVKVAGPSEPPPNELPGSPPRLTDRAQEIRPESLPLRPNNRTMTEHTQTPRRNAESAVHSASIGREKIEVSCLLPHATGPGQVVGPPKPGYTLGFVGQSFFENF